MKKKQVKITREQYLDAINTINAYNTQVTKDFDEMKNNLVSFATPVPITKDTIFLDLKTNVYQTKIVYAIVHRWNYFKMWRDIITVENREDITLEHISRIKKSDILALRNVGLKSIDWLERTLFEAGLFLQD